MAINQPAATAVRANDFVSTLGINTHLNSGAFGYGDLPAVEAAINYLGVKNIRDSAASIYDAQTWLHVANATQAKFDDYIGETSPAGMVQGLGYFGALAAEGILNFVEGGNEEDDDWPVSLGNSLGITAVFQQQLYAAGHALG